MINLSCHCGTVSLTIETKPDFIHACNCTLCHKSGARWGYFSPTTVTVQGDTKTYLRKDKPGAGADIHFCTECGSTTHFTLTDALVSQHGNSIVGVNMWLADAPDLAGLELRYPDGQGWSGEGEFTYVRAPRILE